MTWFFQQSTGILTKDGRFIYEGYAGKANGKNNPDMENIRNFGPIPKGRYTIIGHPFHHPHTGSYSLRLQPDEHNRMYGRAGFLIYGDSKRHLGEASNGCIIMPLSVRQKIWNSMDRYLEVIR